MPDDPIIGIGGVLVVGLMLLLVIGVPVLLFAYLTARDRTPPSEDGGGDELA